MVPPQSYGKFLVTGLITGLTTGNTQRAGGRGKVSDGKVRGNEGAGGSISCTNKGYSRERLPAAVTGAADLSLF
jgi:hypothetical protein